MSKVITLHCKLLAKEHDLLGYTSYVFKNLENAPFGNRYILCTRWPNWQCRSIDIGEEGFLTYQEIIAGQDSWWDGDKYIPYNYSNLVFIKFIKEGKELDSKEKVIIL